MLAQPYAPPSTLGGVGAAGVAEDALVARVDAELDGLGAAASGAGAGGFGPAVVVPASSSAGSDEPTGEARVGSAPASSSFSPCFVPVRGRIAVARGRGVTVSVAASSPASASATGSVS